MKNPSPCKQRLAAAALAALMTGNTIAQEEVSPAPAAPMVSPAAPTPPVPVAPMALIKIQTPSTIRMENDPHWLIAGFAMMGVAKIRNASMSEHLTSELYRLNPNYGGLLADELKKHLTVANIAITDAPQIGVNPDKPWNYKISQLTASGPRTLYVYFETIGIRSHFNTDYYQPKMHIVYCAMTPAVKDDCTFGERIAFGDNYEHEDETTILATPAERWYDDQSAYRRAGEIDLALKRGIKLAAERIAKQIIKASSTPQ